MDYYTLIPALPWLAPLTRLRELPCSTLKLEQRLTMLSREDQQQLRLALSLCRPERPGDEVLSDADEIASWQQQLARLESEPLRQLIEDHLETRSLMAALRYRRAGLADGRDFKGVGSRAWLVRRHWQQPMFGLERQFPWLEHAHAALEKGDSRALEMMLLEQFWQRLWQVQQLQGFSFAAVAAYRLRWALAEYRLRWDGDEAQNHFDSLVEGALTQFRDRPAATTGSEA